MSTNFWMTVMTRITRQDATSLDELIGRFDPRCNPVGRDIFPEETAQIRPEIAFKRVDLACIGVRVVTPRPDMADFAMHLSALALEKDAEIIILNHLDYSGMERFGFRCERVSGATPEAREVCEDQIKRFWGIEIVI